MRVLVTGGYGVLGYHLCKEMHSLGYEIAIVDNKEDWLFDEPYEDIAPIEYFGNDFRRAMMMFNPRKVVHCAEFTDPSIAMSEHAAYTNVGFTTQVVQTCSARGIRCVIPCWYEFVPTRYGGNYIDLWSKTVTWRASIPSSFDKANALNSTVYLPRIISPYQFENNFGSIVKRVYKSIIENKILMIHEPEIPDTYKRTVPWCAPKFAVSAILKMMLRNTRVCFREAGHEITVNSIVRYIAQKFEVPMVEMHHRGKPITVHTSDPNKDFYHHSKYRKFKHIQPLIDEAIDVWEQ